MATRKSTTKKTTGAQRKRCIAPPESDAAIILADDAKYVDHAIDTVSDKKCGNTRVEFGDSLIVADVSKWHKYLIKALNAGDTVSLDGSDLRQVDCAGIQLLAVFVKEVGIQNQTFEWCGASRALYEAANRSGLASLLGLNQTNNEI